MIDYRKFEVGDINYVTCVKCGMIAVPADVRVKNQQQLTSCIKCGVVCKVKVGKGTSVKWDKRWQSKKEVALEVEVNRHGIAVKIKNGDMVNYKVENKAK